MQFRSRFSSAKSDAYKVHALVPNRCVFVVSSLAGIVLKLPRVSYPANESAEKAWVSMSQEGMLRSPQFFLRAEQW
jgi:hypothetical protein